MELSLIRRELHRRAETAHNEYLTAAFIADKLRDIGVRDIREGVGGHGLIATLDSGRPGSALLFRAELDALPIKETLDLPYASSHNGVSHKCGHDGHMALLLGLAHKLADRPLARGKVHLLFQPAEETGEGASRMLEDPQMTGYTPDFIFAVHNLPGFPLHSVLLRDGVFAAGSAGLILRLTGNTAHAAHPEQGRSPAPAVAALIDGFGNLPHKVLADGRYGLATVIHVRIGDPAFGTTPGRAVFMVTLRAWDPDDLEKLCREAVNMAEVTAGTHDLEMQHEWTEEFYPTVNDPAAVALIEKAAHKLPGNPPVRRMSDPFSWSEDFGRFTERFPGALMGLGAGEQHAHLHDTRYDFPDELLETGVSLVIGIIEETGLF